MGRKYVGRGRNMKEQLMKGIWIIKYVLLIFLFLFIASMIRDGGVSEADIKDVVKSVVSTADMTDLSEADNRTVKRLYGIDVNEYEDAVLYVSDSNMKVEEILIIKLKDTSQSKGVEDAVEKRVENQKNSFEGYGVEQCKLLDDSVMDTQENYILFIVNSKAGKADEAFRSSL